MHNAHDKALKKLEIVDEAFEDNYSNKDCETCIRGKMKRKPFPEGGQHPTTRPLEMIHSDVSQIDPPSRGGNRYFVTFQNNFSNFVCAKPMKNKSEVAETFKNFIVKSEVALGLKVKEIQTDNGGEYLESNFQKFLSDRGISHRRSVARRPQQNGKAERMNLTLQNMLRCLLIHSSAPLEFSAEALDTACYILNRVPSSSINGQVPWERWIGKRLGDNAYLELRTFGCQAWAKTDDTKKLADQGEECIFLGYPENI